MTDPASSGEPTAGPLRLAEGLRLLGEYHGSGFAEPRFLVRRADGQVIQLSRLLYLVTEAIAGGDADGGSDAGRVAMCVAAAVGREVTAGNVRYLVAGQLVPLGVVIAGEPGRSLEIGHAAGPAGTQGPVPRMKLLLALKVRGVLLRSGAAGVAGRALAWLHHPVLAGVVLAGFAAFETWLFAVHGVIGPLLDVLREPVLFLAVAGLTLASLLFHEFGHASACRYGGARPGAIGFGLYLVWPSLYTDVTDVYRLGRAGRLRTDLGGVYFNAIFILALGGCYAATGQPVFLAAAFADNFQILQQLAPVVRMDGYFILGDLAGVPDLLGLVVPIMASLLPGAAARRAAGRASGLRRGPRILVTAWVLAAVPLLAAALGYTAWNLPRSRAERAMRHDRRGRRDASPDCSRARRRQGRPGHPRVAGGRSEPRPGGSMDRPACGSGHDRVVRTPNVRAGA
jgi:putative peptide zinc metalloprotease protein